MSWVDEELKTKQRKNAKDQANRRNREKEERKRDEYFTKRIHPHIDRLVKLAGQANEELRKVGEEIRVRHSSYNIEFTAPKHSNAKFDFWVGKSEWIGRPIISLHFNDKKGFPAPYSDGHTTFTRLDDIKINRINKNTLVTMAGVMSGKIRHKDYYVNLRKFFWNLVFPPKWIYAVFIFVLFLSFFKFND